MRWRRDRLGFSLLEVLLASLIFASTIGGLAASWVYSEHSIQTFRNRNAARLLLSQEMSRLTAHTYTNLEDAARDTTLVLVREIDGATSPMEFQVQTTVTENVEETLKDIALSISFQERNENKTLTLRTRVYRSE